MPAFAGGGGYVLIIPKPWNCGRLKAIPTGIRRLEKCARLENVIGKLRDAQKNAKGGGCYSRHYIRGHSLFVLPKVLSKRIHEWEYYEARLKSWLEENSAKSTKDSHSSHRASLASNESTRSVPYSSLLRNAFEEDPLRAFYTIWRSSSTKLSRKKLSTPEQVLQSINSVWESPEVEKLLIKTPRGGVNGRIEDISSLSAKAQDTLKRWSRVTSHFDAGAESGEDEDPVEMWNRAIETSMMNYSETCSVSPNENCPPSRKRNLKSVEADYLDFEGYSSAASVATRTKLTASQPIRGSNDFPSVKQSLEGSCAAAVVKQKPIDEERRVFSQLSAEAQSPSTSVVQGSLSTNDIESPVRGSGKRSSKVSSRCKLEDTPVARGCLKNEKCVPKTKSFGTVSTEHADQVGGRSDFDFTFTASETLVIQMRDYIVKKRILDVGSPKPSEACATSRLTKSTSSAGQNLRRRAMMNRAAKNAAVMPTPSRLVEADCVHELPKPERNLKDYERLLRESVIPIEKTPPPPESPLATLIISPRKTRSTTKKENLQLSTPTRKKIDGSSRSALRKKPLANRTPN